MLTDMRLLAASEETAGSEESEPVAVGLDSPLGWRGLVSPATTAAYAALPTVQAGWNQPTKVLTKGGDLRGAQVDVPWSV
jgi:hypothetical protein